MKLFRLFLSLFLVAKCTCLAQDGQQPSSVRQTAAARDISPAPAPGSWQAVRGRQLAGLRLALTLPKTRYHAGEPIPAKLVFSNDAGDAYHLWIGTYDRSGRIRDISFHAAGEDGSPVGDPLAYYFSHYGSIGGGLGNHQNLGTWEIELPVNQWLRFEKPGKYKLYAQSSRVRAGDKDARYEQPPPHLDVVSDPVEITIEPLSADAEKAIIAEAVRVVSGAREDDPDDATREAGFAAIRRLRFLQTPAAWEALLPLLDSPYGSEARLAFLASKDYAGEAARILQAVEQGRLGLSGNLVWLYANLKGGGSFFAITGEDGKPAPPAPQEDLYAAVRRGLRADGAGEFYFANLLTLFRADPQEPQVRAIMIQRQRDLPQKQIDEAFDDKRLLANKDFLPLLRDLVTPEKHHPHALAALAEVAPEEARPIIIEEIRRESPLFLLPERHATMAPLLFALKALPDRELPELDPVLREKLSRAAGSLEGLETALELIACYATKALLPEVRSMYEPKEGYWACSIQTAALRYWIRCDPAEGVAAVGRALKKRGKDYTGCYHSVLADVLQKQWVEGALPLVLEATADDDLQVIRSTATVLAAHAGPEAIDHLIAAIENVTLRPLPSNPSDRDEQLYVPIEVTSRIINNQRWTPTAQQLERLQKVIVDKSLRERLKGILAARSPQKAISAPLPKTENK